MNGGAWPLLVGVARCLLDCVNERDHRLSIRARLVSVQLHASVWVLAGVRDYFLEGLHRSYCVDGGANSRSVMLLNVLGRTRTTMVR